MTFPIPVGQHVDHGLARPHTLIQVISVLRESCQIYHSEIRAARWPILIVISFPAEVGRRLTDVVESRPHEFTEHAGELVLVLELHIWAICPRRSNDVIAA